MEKGEFSINEISNKLAIKSNYTVLVAWVTWILIELEWSVRVWSGNNYINNNKFLVRHNFIKKINCLIIKQHKPIENTFKNNLAKKDEWNAKISKQEKSGYNLACTVTER